MVPDKRVSDTHIRQEKIFMRIVWINAPVKSGLPIFLYKIADEICIF